MPDRRLDASALRDWAHTAVGDLLRHADEINLLNVFPVADADTGANMLFTMRSALAEADPAAATGDVAEVAAALARGALDGARGNSGVILSQILRGLADVTAEARADTDLADSALADIDAALLGAALRHAVVLVVSAMGGEVVAGTVVSVLQAAAETLSNRAMRADALDALVLVREGAPLASALAQKKRFPGLLAMFARLGEQTGQLPLMLQRAAKQLSTEVQRRAMALATLLEPLLIVAMGGVVMLIVLAVLLPIIQLNQLVK